MWLHLKITIKFHGFCHEFPDFTMAIFGDVCFFLCRIFRHSFVWIYLVLYSMISPTHIHILHKILGKLPSFPQWNHPEVETIPSCRWGRAQSSVPKVESVDFHGSPGLREFGKGFLPPSPLIPGQGITSLKNCLHSLLGFIYCVVSEGLWGLDFLSPWIPVLG